MQADPTSIKVKLKRWLDTMRGRPIEWEVSPYADILKQINLKAEQLKLSEASDSNLQKRAQQLKAAARKTETTDLLLVEAFALVREAAERTLGMRHFDVQMIAGVALSQERFIEMRTGEGKTLVAVLPAFLAALSGAGVHIFTFNDYLAKRDASWMKPLYEFLGITVGYVVGSMTTEQRRQAYLADVTYLTAREAGYDFLRQSLARDKEQIVMRPFHSAIVDEADSVLIDEARVPLVIAGNDDPEEDDDRIRFDAIAAKLMADVDFSCDENDRNVYLTREGIEHVQQMLGCGDLVSEKHRDFLTLINQALHARVLFKKDVDYIVRDGQVKIVDEFTGRVVHDRHWPDGLQQAVEAKERVAVKDRGRILNSITIQHFIGLYPRLCGMTGTVLPSEEELECFYGRRTVVIPPNKPCIRIDHPDRLFTHAAAKWNAIVAEVKAAQVIDRPLLIGTGSVQESEVLARLFEKEGISCHVLNAKNDEQEARIIAQAGAPGAVTVSTNMAGRGTDIRLGGEDEREKERVLQTGGLYVVGTCRFESRRVDDQLRGRAGRQGDPGESRYFISLEDTLMKRFGVADWIPKRYRQEKRITPIDDPNLHKKITLVQRIIEGQNFDIRKTLWEYTSLIEQQRRRMQAKRDQLLLGNSSSHLAELCPDRYRQLADRVPQHILDRVEAQITLFHFDRAWTNHLKRIADIREGIYLYRLGGQSPLRHFIKLAEDQYRQMESEIEQGIAETFRSVAITTEGIDLHKEGLKGPTSTWTYLVNDNPFEWLGSMTEIGNVGYGIAIGLYFGFVFIFQALYRKLFRAK